MSIFSKIFGDPNEKIVLQLQKKVDEINNLEKKFQDFSDADLKNKTSEWQKELKSVEFSAKDGPAPGWDEQQKILDKILPSAFALVREAAQRTLNQRHYDVQLISGMVLHQGNITEMKTGEGKTLASTTAIYLNALTGYGVHVITVNDYLARRDTVWMGQIYNLLGLSVGCLNHESAYLYNEKNQELRIKNQENNLDKDRDEQGNFHVVDDFLQPVERKQAYLADITYGTNNEFGFDYLRDNMVQNLEQKVQRELHFAIVDEVDSILIDEARTPLIISAPDQEPTGKYVEFSRIVTNLKKDEDYNLDEKDRAVTLTEEGIHKVEKMLGVENIYTDRGIKEVHHIESALKAQVLFKKDKNYVVKDGEVIIVDEFTGRLMPGRRYAEGLHQAIEAKEGVEIQRESVTMATITFQNYFRMYKKLAGMTGTAVTEAEEFSKIYNLEVIITPTNKPIVRQDKSDVILKTVEEKYQAIVNEIKSRSEKGQPILVGTISIENNEYLSDLLAREGVEHKVLNAKQHEKEAEIIAQAGKKGAVTIATNMAGRGVDIVLGGNPSTSEEQVEVKKLGGLHVLGTERHESRRIDNQLRGRAGRQGDPGSSQFFVSMEDDLMRIFGGDRMKNLMSTLGLPEGMPIENKIISNSIEKAQKKIEGHNFDIRKHLVEYDDVINKHREVIYKKRNEILTNNEKRKMKNEIILDYIKEEIDSFDFENIQGVVEQLKNIIPLSQEEIKEIKRNKDIKKYLFDLIENKYKELENKINSDKNLISSIRDKFSADKSPMQLIEQMVLLRAIDMFWVEHIDAMDHMRRGIGLSGYAQKDPLVEYKKESYRMFGELLANIRKQVVYSIFKIQLTTNNPEHSGQQTTEKKDLTQTFSSDKKGGKVKVGRNEPCPCGSGKKYKKCCGA